MLILGSEILSLTSAGNQEGDRLLLDCYLSVYCIFDVDSVDSRQTYYKSSYCWCTNNTSNGCVLRAQMRTVMIGNDVTPSCISWVWDVVQFG